MFRYAVLYLLIFEKGFVKKKDSVYLLHFIICLFLTNRFRNKLEYLWQKHKVKKYSTRKRNKKTQYVCV